MLSPYVLSKVVKNDADDMKDGFCSLQILAATGPIHKWELLDVLAKMKEINPESHPDLFDKVSNGTPRWANAVEWILSICSRLGWMEKRHGEWRVPNGMRASIQQMTYEKFAKEVKDARARLGGKRKKAKRKKKVRTPASTMSLTHKLPNGGEIEIKGSKQEIKELVKELVKECR